MTAIKALTQFNFYSEIEKTQGLSLIYFSAQSCGSCKHLTQVLNKLALTDKNLSIFQIDAQQDQTLVKEYEVFHLPALFLFNQGQYHAELQCEARLNSITKAIADASSRPAEEAP